MPEENQNTDGQSTDIDGLGGLDDLQDAGSATQSAESQEQGDETDRGESDDDDRKVSIKALREEREKRQEAQQRAARLEGMLEAMRPQDQQQAQAQHDPHAEENDFFAAPTEWSKAQIKNAISAYDQERWNARVKRSEAAFVKAHKDYYEKAEKFKEAARSNPQLLEDLRFSRDPAEFAYQVARDLEKVQNYKSVEEMRDAIRREVIEDLKRDAAVSSAESIPKTKAGARGSGDVSAETGPVPLDGLGGLD